MQKSDLKINWLLYVLPILAIIGLIFAYVHAGLYTIYGPFMNVRDWDNPPYWATILQKFRWFFRLVGIVSIVGLVAMEIRFLLVSKMLVSYINLRFGLRVILFMIGILSGMYFLMPGYITAATDGIYYTTLAWLVKDSIANAQFPMWSNLGDMGFPLMQFYSPLFFVAVGLVNFVIPDIFESVKLVFLVIHVLSVFAMYKYVYNLTNSKCAGLVAAFTYGFAYYRYHLIIYVNKFTMAPTFLFLPLQLYLVDRIIDGEYVRRFGVNLAFVIAFGLMSHIFFGGYSVIFVVIYSLVRLLSRKQHAFVISNILTILPDIKILIIWIVLGIMVSLPFTLPSLVEADLTVIPQWYENGFFAMPVEIDTTPWLATFTFDGSQGSGWIYGYVGITIVVFALLGGILAIVRGEFRYIAIIFLLTLGMFLALGPIAFFLSAQGQYLIYVVIVGSAGVGLFSFELLYIYNRFVKKNSNHWIINYYGPLLVSAIVCGFIAVDMLRFQLFVNYLVPYTPYGSPENRIEVHQQLLKNGLGGTGRVLDPSQPENGWQIPMITGLPGYENNGDSSVFSASFVRNLRPSNPNPNNIIPYSIDELLGDANDLLLIANTDWVISDEPSKKMLQDYPKAIVTDAGTAMIETDVGLPMLVSHSTNSVAMQTQFAVLAREMNIDQETGVADFIPVLDHNLLDKFKDNFENNIAIDIKNHVMKAQHVSIDYYLSSTAYVQLSYAYYPYLHVMIDGEQTEKFPTAFGLIGIVAPKGVHTIEIVPYLSPLRQVTIFVSVATFLLLAITYLIDNTNIIRGSITLSKIDS